MTPFKVIDPKKLAKELGVTYSTPSPKHLAPARLPNLHTHDRRARPTVHAVVPDTLTSLCGYERPEWIFSSYGDPLVVTCKACLRKISQRRAKV